MVPSISSSGTNYPSADTFARTTINTNDLDFSVLFDRSEDEQQSGLPKGQQLRWFGLRQRQARVQVVVLSILRDRMGHTRRGCRGLPPELHAATQDGGGESERAGHASVRRVYDGCDGEC